MSTAPEQIASQTAGNVENVQSAENVENGGSKAAESKKKRAVFIHPKTQKQLDALKAKQEKLTNDNKALKQQLADLKSSHSRIRRIPKVPSTDA